MKTGNLSRRHFMEAAALAAGGAVLAACQPQVVKETVEVEKIVKETVIVVAEEEKPFLRYWHAWGNDGRILSLWQNSDVYKSMTEGFTVEMLEAVSREKMSIAVAGGDAPDVVGFFDYTNWFLKGLCVPVDAYVEVSKVIDLNDYLPNMVEPATVNGKLLGIAYFECGNRYGLNVNVAQAAEAGLDVDTLPETWDDMLVWHEALTRFDDAGNLELVGYDPYGEMAGQYQAMVAWWPGVTCGVTYFDNDTHKYTFDDPKLIEYIDTCTKFYDLIGPDNMVAYRTSYGQWFQDVVSEAVAMTVNGYWQCGTVATADAEVAKHWQPTWPPVPDYRKGTKIAHPSPHFASILTSSKNPDQSFRLIEYLWSDDACDGCFKGSGYLPGRKSYLAKVDGSTYPGLAWYLDNADKATDYSTVPQDPLPDFNKKTYDTVRERAFRHEITATEAMQELQRVATEEYAKEFGS